MGKEANDRTGGVAEGTVGIIWGVGLDYLIAWLRV